MRAGNTSVPPVPLLACGKIEAQLWFGRSDAAVLKRGNGQGKNIYRAVAQRAADAA